jgi:hypothetical protein
MEKKIKHYKVKFADGSIVNTKNLDYKLEPFSKIRNIVSA